MNKNKKTVQLQKLVKSGKSAKTEKSVPAHAPCNPQIGEYQGKPMLLLDPESKFGFQFGLTKARKIVECYAAIKAFAESEGQSIE